MDPINTTEAEGAACAVCGEDATCEVLPVGHLHPVPVCHDCQQDETTTCPGCDRVIWQDQGHRLEGPSLYCSDCYYTHPAVVGGLAAALAADERAGK